MGFNEPPVATATLEAAVEVFVPHGTLNLTQGLASADQDGVHYEWVMDVNCSRLKCWASRDDKTIVTVELLLRDVLSQMADVASKKVQELEAADGD